MNKTFRNWPIMLGIAAMACLALAAGCMSPAHADASVLALVPSMDFGSGLASIGIGGLVINRANMTMLNRSFNAAFRSGFQTVTATWSKIATEVPSTTGEEEYSWLGKNTRFREWIGDRQAQNLKLHGYTIKNKTFENTVEVERESVEDDKYGVYNMPMQMLGEDAALHPDELVFSLLGKGFTEKCYDGQPFFDADHPVGVQGSIASVSNNQGGAGTAWYLLNVGKLLKPIIYQKRRPYAFIPRTKVDDDNVFQGNKFVYGADGRCNVGFGLWQTAYASKQVMDEDTYGAARASMFGFKFDNGQPVNQGGKMLLVVPPSLEGKALKMVQAERLANGADNVYRNTAEVFVAPWLT